MANAAGEDEILVDTRDHIMRITINRPEARNSINLTTYLQLGGALELAEKDPDVWVVVLTGAGDLAFCAGQDLRAVARGEATAPDDPIARAWGWGGIARHPISKPVIAAVNGFALGGGTEITLYCDLAVAADHAQFGLPEVTRGLYAAGGGAIRLQRQIPHKIAMEMILTGQPISAQRALEVGLVNRVVPREELLDAAYEFAALITANAPISVQGSKRIALGIDDGVIPDESDGWSRATREARIISATEDSKEGPRAFAEKRTPVWSGR